MSFSAILDFVLTVDSLLWKDRSYLPPNLPGYNLFSHMYKDNQSKNLLAYALNITKYLQ